MYLIYNIQLHKKQKKNVKTEVGNYCSAPWKRNIVIMCYKAPRP